MIKRGVSPIIATILLVLIAIIIATIIFFWAKSFLNEKTLKFDQAIEFSCDEVQFEAEAYLQDGASGSKDLGVYVVNRGSIPIYGLQVNKKGLGSISNVGTFKTTISNGGTGAVTIAASTYAFDAGDEVVLTPILIGMQGGAEKAYPCDGSKSTSEITVQDSNV